MGIALILIGALFALLGIIGDIARILIYLGLFVLVVEIVLSITGRGYTRFRR